MLDLAGGGGLRVSVDPEHGGRIVSLRHDDHEWLAPSSPAPAGAIRFVHAGTGGWDEALPTVAPSGGLPDHGDLWDTAWAVTDAAAESLTLVGRSASTGVMLERTIAATAVGVDLVYQASTEEDSDRSFLWSAHPLVAAAAGTRLDVPGVDDLLEEYPTAGSRRALPPASWVDDAGRPSAVKAFVRSDRLPVSAGTPDAVGASIVRADGRRLTFSWRADEIPWLGLYWDTGEFSRGAVLALEPTSAGTDHADLADPRWTVRRGRPREWRIRLTATRP